MNDLQIFTNNEFGQVRVVTQNGEPWFVAIDACEILEIKNTTDAMKRLDDDEATRFNLGGLVGEVNVVNESGLYSLILGSRKPEARKFKKWVTSEILPSIRKHGAYMTPETIEAALLNPDTIIKIATRLKEEQQKRIAAENTIQLQAPKVLFADAVTTSKSSVLVGELAKILRQNGVDIGQNRLFGWLRGNGYLCKAGENFNLPTQYAMDLGLCEIKKTTINKPDGSSFVTRTTKVTGKGQVYFVNKFLQKGGYSHVGPGEQKQVK